MYNIKPSKSASILFTETGCMVRSEDLTEDELREIGFLVYAEENGDTDFFGYCLGMLRLTNRIMKRLGLLETPLTPENMMRHRETMWFHPN